MNFTIDKIKYYLANDFENALFDASISYLENESDPLRFNSFAYSMREVYRHVLTRLAPDEKVIACTDWFDPAVNEGRPTRKYKFLYAVQGGLSEKYIKETLKVDIDEHWKEVRDSQGILSKYTHVNEKSFNIDSVKCKELSDQVLEALFTIFAVIEDTRNEIKYQLRHHIDDELMASFIANTMSDIDLLSSHSYVEGAYVSDYEITDINDQEITFSGEGEAYVSLNYGRGDDAAELNEEFPFKFKSSSRVSNPEQIFVDPNDISIDTQNWYE